MITEQDLQAAIAECQGVRNPTSSTCLKLAAYYTLQDKMFGRPNEVYSFAKEPSVKQVGEITYSSDTEFARLISGRAQAEIWPIMDELMSVLAAVNPRLYDSVIRKLRA